MPPLPRPRWSPGTTRGFPQGGPWRPGPPAPAVRAGRRPRPARSWPPGGWTRSRRRWWCPWPAATAPGRPTRPQRSQRRRSGPPAGTCSRTASAPAAGRARCRAAAIGGRGCAGPPAPAAGTCPAPAPPARSPMRALGGPQPHPREWTGRVPRRPLRPAPPPRHRPPRGGLDQASASESPPPPKSWRHRSHWKQAGRRAAVRSLGVSGQQVGEGLDDGLDVVG